MIPGASTGNIRNAIALEKYIPVLMEMGSKPMRIQKIANIKEICNVTNRAVSVTNNNFFLAAISHTPQSISENVSHRSSHLH